MIVSLGDRSYPVILGSGNLPQLGAELLRCGLAGRGAVVTDSNVGPLYAEAVCSSLRESGLDPVLITVSAGEQSKCLAEVENICRAMIRAGLDRKSFLVALGGGVTGDLAGFAAAVYYRGIPYAQVPTTVMAQVDSSVGGKTGVNAEEGKNLIGAFHQPRLVFGDVRTLSTLPPREYHEGFAEIIKHAAIRDASLLDMVEAERAGTLDEAGRVELIRRNVAIKAAIVSEDEFETKDLRALLNFGHTIGHAIEASAGYGTMLHGEAIALGLRAALYLSRRLAGLPIEEEEQVLGLLAAYQLPLVLDERFETAALLVLLARDKKFSAGKIRFVLVPRLGQAMVSREVTPEHVREAIEHLRTPCLKTGRAEMN